MRAIGLAAAWLACSCGPAPRQVARPEPRGIAAPRVVPGTLDAKKVLGDVPERAQRAGAGPLVVVASGQMVDDDRLGAFVEPPAEMCLLAFARGSSSLEDLDLAAFSDEGNPVAVDEGRDPKPTLLVCPPHPDRLYLAMHAAHGEGLATLGAQLVPRERAQDVAKAVGARGVLGGTPRRSEQWPGLSELLAQRRAALGGRWEEVHRVILALDTRAPALMPLAVDADACTDVVVVPDDDVGNLDLEILDHEGRSLSRARDGGAQRGLTLCSTAQIPATLTVRPHIGRGIAAIVVSRARGDVAKDLATAEIAWAATALPLERTVAGHEAALARAGYGPGSKPTHGTLATGRRTRLVVETAASGCTRIDVVAGAPLAMFSARSADDAGVVVGAVDGADRLGFHVCGRPKVFVDLDTRGSPGPFSLTTRKEPWQDAAFVARPLAASRMLSRLLSGPAQILEGAPGQVRALAVEAGKVASFEESIPAGRCVKLATGVEGDGAGVELRVFDAEDWEELDRGGGVRATAVRACAGGKPRKVKIEISIAAGKVDAVVAERSL
jgi:hypothetical protein